jgi:hypothetical protein
VTAIAPRHHTELATRPSLRRALRQLYPEFPVWVRRLLVINPASPPRGIPPVFGTSWATHTSLREEFLAQVAHHTAEDPQKGWRIIRRGEWYLFVDKHKRPCRHPHLMINGIGIESGSTDDRAKSVRMPSRHGGTIQVIVERGRSGPSLGFHAELLLETAPDGTWPEMGWYFYAPRDPSRYMVRNLTMMPSLRHAQCADGLPALIPPPGEAWGPDDPGGPYNPEAIQDLVTRWSRLPTAHAQGEVAGFWLGHPNPILAQAGLATMARSRITHRA